MKKVLKPLGLFLPGALKALRSSTCTMCTMQGIILLSASSCYARCVGIFLLRLSSADSHLFTYYNMHNHRLATSSQFFVSEFYMYFCMEIHCQNLDSEYFNIVTNA